MWLCHSPSPFPSSSAIYLVPHASLPLSFYPPDTHRLFSPFLQLLPSPMQSPHSPHLSFLAHLPTRLISHSCIYTSPDPLFLCQVVNVVFGLHAFAVFPEPYLPASTCLSTCQQTIIKITFWSASALPLSCLHLGPILFKVFHSFIGQIRVSKSSNLHVFELREETGALREKSFHTTDHQ